MTVFICLLVRVGVGKSVIFVLKDLTQGNRYPTFEKEPSINDQIINILYFVSLHLCHNFLTLLLYHKKTVTENR